MYRENQCRGKKLLSGTRPVRGLVARTGRVSWVARSGPRRQLTPPYRGGGLSQDHPKCTIVYFKGQVK
jgi:hypothetical protein